MPSKSIPWNTVIPWSALVVVLACGAARVAPVAPAPPAAAPQTSFKTLDAEEIILHGKDGAVRGKLTGESLSLSDASGNKVEVVLGTSTKVTLTNAKGDIAVALDASADDGAIAVIHDDKLAMLSVAADGTDLQLVAGGRKIVGGVETARPLADLEMFDAAGKRRSSFGLNSNGDPRLSLYDANETRRIYGILTDDVAVLDLNDNKGAAAVEVFGADPARGSGVNATSAAKTVSMGVDLKGKPLK